MVAINEKIEMMLFSLTNVEKIRMFYEIAKQVVESGEPESEELQKLFADIKQVIKDIESI